MTQSSRPIIRLLPKANARAIRHGAPLIWQNELVLDRRTKAMQPGTIAELQDAEHRPLGLIAATPSAKLAGRMLDQDPTAEINVAWFRAKIAHALAHRSRIYAKPFYRLIHAEGDGLPGIIIDRFDDTLVVQPNAAWAEAHLSALVEALLAETGVSTIVKNASGRQRAMEGLDDVSSVLVGSLNGPVEVPMNGALYLADLEGGQKTGLFYDQRENHAFVARMANGRRVLDVFSHVGGFALAALAAGAESALSVDGSEPALALATEGAARMGMSDRFETKRSDAFKALEGFAAEGAQFDLVICDPPAFAPSKQAVDAGLRAYERIARMAVPLVAAGGDLVLCSCSQAADLPEFRAACIRGIGKAGRRAQLVYTGFAGPDHPQHPALADQSYLKTLVFRLLP